MSCYCIINIFLGIINHVAPRHNVTSSLITASILTNSRVISSSSIYNQSGSVQLSNQVVHTSQHYITVDLTLFKCVLIELLALFLPMQPPWKHTTLKPFRIYADDNDSSSLA